MSTFGTYISHDVRPLGVGLSVDMYVGHVVPTFRAFPLRPRHIILLPGFRRARLGLGLFNLISVSCCAILAEPNIALFRWNEITRIIIGIRIATLTASVIYVFKYVHGCLLGWWFVFPFLLRDGRSATLAVHFIMTRAGHIPELIGLAAAATNLLHDRRTFVAV